MTDVNREWREIHSKEFACGFYRVCQLGNTKWKVFWYNGGFGGGSYQLLKTGMESPAACKKWIKTNWRQLEREAK